MRVALAVLAFVASASPAAADPAADAAERWGLIGLWKLDCTKGPSREDPSFRYVVRGGKLYQERDSGGAKDANIVSLAEAGADRTLELTVILPPPSPARTLVLRHEGSDRFSVRSNRAIGTDDYTIKDGRLPDGKPARVLLTRCSKYGGPA